MDRQKVIQLYKKLGANLILQGQRFLKKAFHVKYTQTISSTNLKSFLSNLGIPRENVYCADRKYAIIDWEVMKDIIAYDFGDRKEYLVCTHDCDDFANAFKANLSEIYGVNSIGLAKNVMVHIKAKDKNVYHRCNLILATSKGVLKAFLFESQTDAYQEIVKGVPIVMGDWEYKVSMFDF